jgi:ATP-dependent Clp protease adaptor protein ClpS
MAEPKEHDGDVATETRTKNRLARPRLYKVLLHNDDYTTREFVVHILQTVFYKPEPEAVRIMLHVHHSGVGVAGLYTREIAETKIRTVEQLARQNEYPLKLSMEPEDTPEGEE